jgi:signal peptidase I
VNLQRLPQRRWPGKPISPRDYFGPLKVPEGQYLMMGDNRDRSYDSRFWGLVNRDEVEGRVLYIYGSLDADSSALMPMRWPRLGMRVQ